MISNLQRRQDRVVGRGQSPSITSSSSSSSSSCLSTTRSDITLLTLCLFHSLYLFMSSLPSYPHSLLSLSISLSPSIHYIMSSFHILYHYPHLYLFNVFPASFHLTSIRIIQFPFLPFVLLVIFLPYPYHPFYFSILLSLCHPHI